MSKLNCWEFKKCGRELGGAKAEKLGVCSAANSTEFDGSNGGRNGGRICWSTAGTLCGDKVQGVFAEKLDNCMTCDFYNKIAHEELEDFLMYPVSDVRVNCWEFKKCGRESDGKKTKELGVCTAASDSSVNGFNNGKNGGRVCWALAGTLCGGQVQGVFAQKLDNCITCDFYNKVLNEEPDFGMYHKNFEKDNKKN